MIYIELNGRLGNNLFQIAAAASLAKKNNSDFTAVCIDKEYIVDGEKWYLSKYIDPFKDIFYKNVKFIYQKPEIKNSYNEPNYTFNKLPYENDIYLSGWFQSEKYFDKELVRDMYQIPEDIKTYIQNKYGYILSGDNINSINVRRGDYLNIPHEFQICSLIYYKKAIKLIGEKEKYIVISDDIEWCKENFKGDNFIFIDNEEPLVDLYLQSFCKNNIIANSTFSWWAAWINPHKDKQVVCPAKWFGLRFRKNKETDLIPDSWIKIKNRMTIKDTARAYRLYFRDKFREKKRNLRKSLRPVKRLYLQIFNPKKMME